MRTYSYNGVVVETRSLPTAVFLAVCSTIWGFSTLTHPGVYSTRQVYYTMLEILPQWAWGCLWLFTGLLLWATILFRVPPKVALLANYWNLCFYGFACAMRVHPVGYFAPGFSFDIMAVLMAAWLCIKTTVDKPSSYGLTK